MSEELVRNHNEALEYARKHAEPEIGQLLEHAIGAAVIALASDEKDYYLEGFPDHRLDMLLYVKLLDRLFQNRARLAHILKGNYSDDWLSEDLEKKLSSEWSV